MLSLPEIFRNNVFRYEKQLFKLLLQNTKYKKRYGRLNARPDMPVHRCSTDGG